MTAFTKVNSFIEAVYEKKHNVASDTFKVMLSNVAPVVTNSVKANLTEIAAGNGYVAGGVALTIATSSETGGVYTAVVSGDIVFTATGGSIASFRYVPIYNDTALNDELVGWYDYGSTITPADGETFTVATDGLVLITAS